MKKIFLLFTAAMMALGVASAQDINEATTNYNNGATELQMGNLEAALTYFQTALQMGESLGEPAAELVANCKTAICSVTLAQAKDLYNAKDFAGAVEAFNKAKEVAEGYGDAEVAAEAEELAAQANKLQYNTAGTAALRAKDYPAAVEAFKKVLELEPDNGNAAVQLGQAYYRSNQFDAAIEALTVAQANGQEDNAEKLLSQVYLKLSHQLVLADELLSGSTILRIVDDLLIELLRLGVVSFLLVKNSDCICYTTEVLSLWRELEVLLVVLDCVSVVSELLSCTCSNAVCVCALNILV